MLGDPWPVPHITVKSPEGLTPDLMWLPKVREAAARSKHFSVKIGPPRAFDNRVLYLSVESAGLERLHRSIEEVFPLAKSYLVDSSNDRAFIPHLTLSVAREDHKLPPVGAWGSTLLDFDRFEISELTVFRRDVPSTHYEPWITLPLKGSRAR